MTQQLFWPGTKTVKSTDTAFHWKDGQRSIFMSDHAFRPAGGRGPAKSPAKRAADVLTDRFGSTYSKAIPGQGA